MKKQLLLIITTVALLLFPGAHFGQTPNLGTAANFILFTSVGAVSNIGSSHLTGNVGTNTGSSTGFGNVNGEMHDTDPESAQAAADLLLAYNELNAMLPTGFLAPIMGSGQTLNPGVYLLGSASSLNNELILDGQGDPNAVFVFQIEGAFAVTANSRVTLMNGTVACNVFWMVEGQIDLATGTSMKGTMVANNAAIAMAVNVTLEGRALSTTGAVSITATNANLPLGCGTPALMGPSAPGLGAVESYTIFAADNIATNFGTTNAIGDIGSNNGGVSGYDQSFVTGIVHTSPDASTLAAATDVSNAYNYLNALPHDIELLYPAQFGNQLELTPHTYLLNSAATFVDTLFLNAQGDPDAVFVIKINGALSTGTFSKVSLRNGAQAENVFWKVEGAVSIADFSQFVGTIIANTGVMNISNGVQLDGRALALTEAITTTSITAIVPNFLAKTKLEAIHCDQNLPSMATKINAIRISGATKYRFKVINGTASFETAPSTSSYFYIGAVTNVKYETTYDVSVQYQFNNQWSEYGATCTVTTPASPVSPKLEDAFCDKTLATIGTKINAIGITGATSYRFRITLGGTVFETTPSSLRYFYMRVVPNVKYGTTYNVAVQYQYEGDWADYGDACDVTTPSLPASPKLEDAFCDKTLTTYATKISAVGITAATAYRFKITLGESSFETTPSASRSFYMNVMPGVKYATTYEVRVQYQYEGDWVTYGDPCNITTPTKPLATLEAASCDVTLPSMVTKINATGITSATHYRFKVTLGETTFETPASTSRYFYMSAIPNVKYAATYSVQTEYNYNDTWSTYGAACSITTPARPVSTQLEAASCDITLPTLGTKVNATGITAATKYRFKITLDETSYETTPSTSRYFYMSAVPNVQEGTTYSVQAQYQYEGIWSDYATACDVTTPGTQTIVITNDNKETQAQGISLPLTAYPNPTKASFKLKAEFESEELVAISIYDVTGRQLETITVKPYEVETLEFGANYINGMYQVVMTQGETSTILKVVKE